MTKKGYQKRLPTVLPTGGPRPVVHEHRDVPPPRASRRDTADPGRARSSPVEPDEPLTTDRARRARRAGTVPVTKRRRSIHRPKGAAAAWRCWSVLDPQDGRGASCRRLAVVGLAVPPAPCEPWRADVPGPLRGREPTQAVRSELATSYVASEVLPNGDVVVRQRIRAVRADASCCASSCPLAPGDEGVSARAGRRRRRRAMRSSGRRRSPTVSRRTPSPLRRTCEIRYRLTGAVELSESAQAGPWRW